MSQRAANCQSDQPRIAKHRLQKGFRTASCESSGAVAQSVSARATPRIRLRQRESLAADGSPGSSRAAASRYQILDVRPRSHSQRTRRTPRAAGLRSASFSLPADQAVRHDRISSSFRTTSLTGTPAAAMSSSAERIAASRDSDSRPNARLTWPSRDKHTASFGQTCRFVAGFTKSENNGEFVFGHRGSIPVRTLCDFASNSTSETLGISRRRVNTNDAANSSTVRAV
jgi:hypothetical protein